MDVIELGQDIAKGTDLWSSNLATVYYNDFPIEHPFYIGFSMDFPSCLIPRGIQDPFFKAPLGRRRHFLLQLAMLRRVAAGTGQSAAGKQCCDQQLGHCSAYEDND